MEHVWTWSGKFFGYISNGRLFTQKGKCVGALDDEMIYGRDGKYIGEIRNNNRLITNKSRKNCRGNSAPNLTAGSCSSYCDYTGYVMYAGYEDFPSQEKFN